MYQQPLQHVCMAAHVSAPQPTSLVHVVRSMIEARISSITATARLVTSAAASSCSAASILASGSCGCLHSSFDPDGVSTYTDGVDTDTAQRSTRSELCRSFRSADPLLQVPTTGAGKEVTTQE